MITLRSIVAVKSYRWVVAVIGYRVVAMMILKNRLNNFIYLIMNLSTKYSKLNDRNCGCFVDLVIDYWNLFDYWCLELGIFTHLY